MTSLLTKSLPAEHVSQREVPTAEPVPQERPARLVSLDAYRGFIMLAMASAGLAIPTVAKSFAGDPTWQFLAYQTDHAPWIGCSFWDLIQPSFMFMVGVAIPYSYASRRARGDSERKILAHSIWRAFLLVALAVFLSSPLRFSILGLGGTAGPAASLVDHAPTTNFVFTNVLAQIGLGYVFVVLLRGKGLRVQFAALAAILAGYTLLFGLWPVPGSGFDYESVGGLPAGKRLTGWFAHWDKNTNAAAAFDVWFLNLFPRPFEFRFNEGGYQTLNFIPSMATMLLGLMAGEMLRGRKSPQAKFLTLATAGAACLALGWVTGQFVCPIVKRIWTPSWALFSAGWTFFLLAAFYWVIDLQGWRRWAFPFVVVGMNSIAMYCMSMLMKPWIRERLKMHLNSHWFEGVYGPMILAASVLFMMWLVCLWMYRRKIFLRL